MKHCKPWFLSVLVLAACGGGGGGGSASDSNTASTQSCSNTEQLGFVRQHINNDYLFYQGAPQTSALSYSGTPGEFFHDLTRAGQPEKDRFSFVITKEEADAMFIAGSASGVGIDTRRDSLQNLRVALVQPGSPAAIAGIRRGDQITAINNTTVGSSLSRSQINALYYGKIGDRVTLSYTRLADGQSVSKTLAASSFSSDPVPMNTILTSNGSTVGYLAFHEHTKPAESKLATAFNNFRSAGISDLVVDLRYNGGGYLTIASELAYMIAGSQSMSLTNTSGYKTFLHLTHNNKRSSKDTDLPFIPFKYHLYSDSRISSWLPGLNLKRVFVLTTSSTCSASESLINGLRGIDVEVITIGSSSCGKPYGMYETENCGNAYYALAFKGSNAKGFGEFTDGLSPTCTASDDFNHELGNSEETLLATALSYRKTGTCPAATVTALALQSDGTPDARIVQDAVPLRGGGTAIMR